VSRAQLHEGLVVNKPLQATRDAVSSSAFEDHVIRPACLSWTLGDNSISPAMFNFIL